MSLVTIKGPASAFHGVLVGRVLVSGGGQPVARAQVELVLGSRPFAATTADAEGRYLFARAPRGEYRLQARPPAGTTRLRPCCREGVLDAGAVTRVDLELALITITGTITDSDRAVAGAAVRLAGSDERTWSNELGKYELVAVEPGVRTLVVTHAARDPVTRVVEVAADVPTLADIDLTSQDIG